jgi:HlyD family secretion protein
MKKILVILLVLVVVLAVTLSIRIHQLNASQRAPSGGSGTIEATEVNIAPRLAGRLIGVRAREGDDVKAGELLVELDCAEPEAIAAEAKARLQVALASVNSARSAAEAAQGSTSAAYYGAIAASAQRVAGISDEQTMMKEAERITNLHQQGAITDSQLEQVETRTTGVSKQLEAYRANEQAARAKVQAAAKSASSADAQTEVARHNVEIAEAVLKRAEISVRDCKVYAPRDGVVMTRNFEPGEVVSPGAAVLTVVDLSELRTTFYLPNAELAVAATGKTVRLRADAWPSEAFSGKILRVSPKAEFTPRNVQTREDRDRLVYAIEVIVQNREGKLRPGMPVEAIIEGTAR